MNLGSLKESIRPRRETGLQVLIPVATVLISGMVILLTVSPAYLRELHPLTLLLLSVACALPVWALNQLMWWQVGRSITGAIIAKMTYILDVAPAHKKAYAFALSQLLKSIDVLRFVPYRDIANLTTVITIYAGAAICYLTECTPAMFYGWIIGLSVVVWLLGLFALQRSCRKIDVEPLHELWHELKDKDALLAMINEHLARMEKILIATVGRDRADSSENEAGTNSGASNTSAASRSSDAGRTGEAGMSGRP